MLFSLQEVIEFIGRQLRNEPNKIIAQQTELLATVTSGGSYCIDLVAASTNVNLFQESLIGDSLERFLNLIEISNRCVKNENFNDDSSNEEFTVMVNNLGIQLTSKYCVFLNYIASAKSDVDFNWGSPNPKKGGSAKLTYKNVVTAIDLIEKMANTVSRILEITGTLIAGNVTLRRFVIKDASNDFNYRGKISNSLMNSDTDMTLDCIYHATIEETIESNRTTGETKLKYKLIDLRKFQNESLVDMGSTGEILHNNLQGELSLD